MSGLKSSQIKALERLGQRRYPIVEGFTLEQARELCALSRSLGKQIGLLIDRQGRAEMVILGERDSILIPELPRSREGAGRLRGIRLLHTHLEQRTDSARHNKKQAAKRTGSSENILSREDLMDLLFLRLDSMSVLTVGEFGEPLLFQQAHLCPQESSTEGFLVHEVEAFDRCSTDFQAQTLALEEELSRTSSGTKESGSDEERCILVSVSTQPKNVQESSLRELAELARTAGLTVAGSLMQRVQRVDYNQILGRGKLAELEVLALQGHAAVIVFDLELSPAQLRDLGDATERKVIDRTQLILDIFAQRASSRGGKLQVELAQLQYRLPRLVGRSKALDRLAGGIGGKGPGETKLETDRRRLRERITRLNEALRDLRKQRANVRGRRAKARLPVVSLVGYTNAGKSTLLNALTGSEVLAEDKLFATLDPSSRRLRFPQERELVLTDTVGFIRRLPKELMEAFRATLEELEESDLLLHVVDVSHPEMELQIAAVDNILESLNLQNIPRVLVYNKTDALSEDDYHARRVDWSAAEPADLEAYDAMLQYSPGSIETFAEAGMEAPARSFTPETVDGISFTNSASMQPGKPIYVSALNRQGLDDLARAIISMVDWKSHQP